METLCLHFLFPSCLKSPPGLGQVASGELYSSEQMASNLPRKAQPSPRRRRWEPEKGPKPSHCPAAARERVPSASAQPRGRRRHLLEGSPPPPRPPATLPRWPLSPGWAGGGRGGGEGCQALPGEQEPCGRREPGNTGNRCACRPRQASDDRRSLQASDVSPERRKGPRRQHLFWARRPHSRGRGGRPPVRGRGAVR